MACHMQPLVKIGKYIFVHGAILPSHLDSESPSVNNERLQTLTDLVKRYLLGELSLETFQRDYPKEFKIVNPQGEMFWNRELSKQSANGRCEKAESVLKKLGADEATLGTIMSGQFAFAGFSNAFLLAPVSQMLGGRLGRVVQNCVAVLMIMHVAQALVYSEYGVVLLPAEGVVRQAVSVVAVGHKVLHIKAACRLVSSSRGR